MIKPSNTKEGHSETQWGKLLLKIIYIRNFLYYNRFLNVKTEL